MKSQPNGFPREMKSQPNGFARDITEIAIIVESCFTRHDMDSAYSI